MRGQSSGPGREGEDNVVTTLSVLIVIDLVKRGDRNDRDNLESTLWQAAFDTGRRPELVITMERAVEMDDQRSLLSGGRGLKSTCDRFCHRLILGTLRKVELFRHLAHLRIGLFLIIFFLSAIFALVGRSSTRMAVHNFGKVVEVVVKRARKTAGDELSLFRRKFFERGEPIARDARGILARNICRKDGPLMRLRKLDEGSIIGLIPWPGPGTLQKILFAYSTTEIVVEWRLDIALKHLQ